MASEPLDTWDEPAALGSLDGGITAKELMGLHFDPLRYVVPGYIVEGLTVLAGPPKSRKSWMMLDAAVAVASGGHAFGTVLCVQGDVLCLALEDNRRRLQDRLRRMGVIEGPHRLTFATEWAIGDEAVGRIETWARRVEKPTLVIVDVLARVREFTTREASYDADYRALQALQDLASKMGFAIVVIHHTRKAGADDPFDEVSGTRGITGAPDTVLVVRRDNSGGLSFRATLYGRGRDISEIETAIEFDDEFCRWKIMGEAWKVADTAEQQEILELLQEAEGPMRRSEIAEALGKTGPNVGKMLSKMVDAGLVSKPATGRYAPVTTVTPVTPKHDGHGSVTAITVVTDSPIGERWCPKCNGDGCLYCGGRGGFGRGRGQ